MRIAVAGFMHESNSFLIKPTTRQSYQERALKRGEEIAATWKDAHHEMGGFLEGAQRHGFTAVPLVMGDAMPSGPLTRDGSLSQPNQISPNASVRAIRTRNVFFIFPLSFQRGKNLTFRVLTGSVIDFHNSSLLRFLTGLFPVSAHF